jgi:hypothetical protein
MVLLQNSATSATFDTIVTPPPRNTPEQQQAPPRSNYISFAQLTNNVTTNFNLVTINDANSSSASSSIMPPLSSKEAVVIKEEISNSGEAVGGSVSGNKSSNTYLLKSNNLNNNNFCNNLNGIAINNHHQRHMSVPVGGNVTPIKTLPTSSSTFQASITPKIPNSSPLKAPSAGTSSKFTTVPASNLQLYENVKIKSLNNINNNHNNSNNVNVSYENINLEYINRLMKEGYSKESVISALCISRNNFEMACDILHEFVSTSQQQKLCADK